MRPFHSTSSSCQNRHFVKKASAVQAIFSYWRRPFMIDRRSCHRLTSRIKLDKKHKELTVCPMFALTLRRLSTRFSTVDEDQKGTTRQAREPTGGELQSQGADGHESR